MKSFLLSCLILLSFIGSLSEASAQASTSSVTDFITSKKPEKPKPQRNNFSNTNTAFPRLSFGQDNFYFDSIIKLQYQISLMQVLIDRQSQDEAIKNSFEQLNLPYVSSAPSKSLCEELPKNDLCKHFYFDLYEDGNEETLFADLKIDKQELDDHTLQDVINQHVVNKKNEKSKKKVAKEKAKLKRRAPLYEWADISCVKLACKATLINVDTGHRITVYPGYQILNDKLVVESVAFNNIVVKNDQGKTMKLQPALSSEKGGGESPFLSVSLGTNSSTVSNEERRSRQERLQFLDSEEGDVETFDDDVDVDVLLESLNEEDAFDDILIIDQ